MIFIFIYGIDANYVYVPSCLLIIHSNHDVFSCVFPLSLLQIIYQRPKLCYPSPGTPILRI